MLQGHPSIRRVAVSAVTDEVRGEEVMACIVATSGAAPGFKVAADIVDWTMERLAYYKAPGWVSFVADLPTTATQKIQRGELRSLADWLLVSPDTIDLRSRKRRRSVVNEPGKAHDYSGVVVTTPVTLGYHRGRPSMRCRGSSVVCSKH